MARAVAPDLTTTLPCGVLKKFMKQIDASQQRHTGNHVVRSTTEMKGHHRANVKARSSASASLRQGRERRRHAASQQRHVAREELLSAKRFKLHDNAISAGAVVLGSRPGSAGTEGAGTEQTDEKGSIGDLLGTSLSFQST